MHAPHTRHPPQTLALKPTLFSSHQLKMVSNINSLFHSLLLFYIFFFVLVMGDSPTDAPAPAPLSSSNISTPAHSSTHGQDHGPTPVPMLPGPKGSAPPAGVLPTPAGCDCSFDLKTVLACSVFLVSPGGLFSEIPRQLCCEGLRGLNEADVYSCLCYIVNSRIPGKPIINLPVEAAIKIVSLGCRS